MNRYFIAATDYGSKADNERFPRWRVYTWGKRRTWPSGHIPTIPKSGYFWSEEEALKEIERLEQQDADDSLFGWVAVFAGVAVFVRKIVSWVKGQ